MVKKKAFRKKVSKKKATKKKAVRKKAAAKKAAFKPDRLWLTQTEAVKCFGVATQVFQRYGIEPVARNGRYAYYAISDLIQYADGRGRKLERQRLEKYIRDADDMDPAVVIMALERAQLRWTEERAEGQRLRNAQMRRELAPVEMMTWAISSGCSQVAAVLETIPGKIKRVLPNLSNAEVELVKREIVKIQNIAANVTLDWDEFERAGQSGTQPAGD